MQGAHGRPINKYFVWEQHAGLRDLAYRVGLRVQSSPAVTLLYQPVNATVTRHQGSPSDVSGSISQKVARKGNSHSTSGIL